MHIAIDAINFNDRIRGPDRYLVNLLEGLAHERPDHEYTILHAPWQTYFGTLKLPDNFRFVCCHPPRNPILRVLWHVISFPREVRRVAPDLVHLSNVIYTPRLGLPLVMTVHDLAHFRFPEKFGPIKGRLQRWMIRAAGATADRIIAVSEFTRLDLSRFTNSPDEKVRVVLEGGPEPVSAMPPEKSDTEYFLYVGQIERSKNVENMIEAFLDSEELARMGVELWVAGLPGNAAATVQRILEQRSTSRVRLLGYVDDASLPALFGGCLGFVFPSLVEGFGLVVLEAMAYGAPLICSDATVLPEVVGDGGMLVDARGRKALRRAMEQVARDPALREALRRRGRTRLADFSWRRAARETCCVYEELLS